MAESKEERAQKKAAAKLQEGIERLKIGRKAATWVCKKVLELSGAFDGRELMQRLHDALYAAENEVDLALQLQAITKAVTAAYWLLPNRG